MRGDISCLVCKLEIGVDDFRETVPIIYGKDISNVNYYRRSNNSNTRDLGCCCCLPCNHCINWTWVVEEILAFYGPRLHSTHCREFNYLKLPHYYLTLTTSRSIYVIYIYRAIIIFPLLPLILIFAK